MSCSELVGLVIDYFESVLPTPELVRFEEHLAACPACRPYLVQMRRTAAAMGHLTEERVQPDAGETLAWSRERPRGGRGPITEGGALPRTSSTIVVPLFPFTPVPGGTCNTSSDIIDRRFPLRRLRPR